MKLRMAIDMAMTASTMLLEWHRAERVPGRAGVRFAMPCTTSSKPAIRTCCWIILWPGCSRIDARREIRDGSNPNAPKTTEISITVKEGGRLERESMSYVDVDEIGSVLKGESITFRKLPKTRPNLISSRSITAQRAICGSPYSTEPEASVGSNVKW